MDFIKGVLSGRGGQGSTQRVCLFATIFLMLAWSTRIVILKAIIPEIPDTWVWLISVLVAGITGAKGVDAYRSAKGANNVNATPPAV